MKTLEEEEQRITRPDDEMIRFAGFYSGKKPEIADIKLYKDEVLWI